MNKILFVLSLAILLGIQIASRAAEPSPKRLLIIVPANLRAAVEDYSTYKSKQLPTQIVELESALKSADGVDDPERLKRYLFQQWKRGDLGYVLLVGDADVLPVRYMTLDRNDERAFNYSFYPCDLYYADLARADG